MILYENNTHGRPYFYSVYSAENLSLPLHLHLYYECISAKAGTAEVTAGQDTYLLTPGNTAFICLNQLHSIRPVTPCELTILQFSPDLVGHFTDCCQGLYPANPILPSVPIVPDEFRTDNIFRQKELLYHLCWLLTQSTEFLPLPASGGRAGGRLREYSSSLSCKTDIGSPEDAAREGFVPPAHAVRAVPQIFQYVSEHFQEECNLKKLSKELGYNYTYLSRAFRHTVKLTFTEYLNQYRIHHACLLLRDSGRNISDVAYRCGYESLRSFNRNFQAVMHTTPGKWRENSGAGPYAKPAGSKTAAAPDM